MTQGFLTLGLVTLVTAGVAQAGTVVVSNDRERGTRDCRGGDAVVSGNNNRLMLVDCRRLKVTGDSNKLETTGTSDIAVLGNRNKVSWHLLPEERAPKVSNLGSSNKVARAAERGPETGERHAERQTDEAEIVVDRTGVRVDSDVRVDAKGVEIGGVRIDENGVSMAGNKRVGPFTVNGNEREFTHDCEGGDATVNGNDNRLTLRNCGAVTVRGNDNVVDAGSPKALTVMGQDNRLSWNDADGGTEVRNLGEGNQLGRR